MRPPVTPFEIASRVREALGGSQDAYTWLYRRFAPLVHAIHLGKAPRALAEELTQDTFNAAFTRLAQLRDPHRFGPWIAAIARHQQPALRSGQVGLDEVAEAASDASGPEDVTEAARVLYAVRTLPEAYRETLLLRLVEGMSGPEIAALTGLAPASVRVNLHRGMARLRKVLGLGKGNDEVLDVHAG